MKECPSILYVNPTQQLRSGIKTLTKAISTNRYNITVLHPEDGKEQVTKFKGIDYKFYKAHYVPGVRYTLPTKDFFQMLMDLIPDTDIIHIYSYFYPICTISSLCGRFSDCNVVISVDSLPGINWSYGSKTVDIIGKGYTTSLGRITFSCANKVIALEEYLKEDLRNYAPKNRIEIIPNGVDTEYFRPKSNTNQLSNNINLLFVGRLDPVKGLPYLLKAFYKLKGKSEYNFRLTIVGEGTNREELESLASQLGILEQIDFVGWQDNVRPFYRNSDIFILPSLAEGQPTVLMEAQACGLPIIATNVGGIESLIGTGRIVPRGDSDSLTMAIENLCNSWSPTIPIRARKHIVENYTEEMMCSSYINLYHNLLYQC